MTGTVASSGELMVFLVKVHDSSRAYHVAGKINDVELVIGANLTGILKSESIKVKKGSKQASPNRQQNPKSPADRPGLKR